MRTAILVVGSAILVVGMAILFSGCNNYDEKLSHAATSNTGAEKTSARNAVEVVKIPLYVEHGAFVEKRNADSAYGLTEWFFHCYPKFEYSSQVNRSGAKTKAEIMISKVKLTISCPVNMRVGNRPDIPTKAHEDGHVEIIKQIYSTAETHARNACEQVVGEKFSGTGADEEEAISDAVDQVSRKVCAQYTDKTVQIANRVSATYDEITKHGYAKVPVQEAIKRAFALEVKTNPTSGEPILKRKAEQPK